jgi:hypothetical protein
VRSSPSPKPNASSENVPGTPPYLTKPRAWNPPEFVPWTAGPGAGPEVAPGWIANGRSFAKEWRSSGPILRRRGW